MSPTSLFKNTKLTPILAGFALGGLALALAACSKEAKPATVQGPAFKTPEEKVSYGIGYNMGKGLAKQKGFTVDLTSLRAGIDDGLADVKTRLPEADIQTAFTAVQQKVAAANAAEGEKQLAAGQAFLETNRKRAGVTATASGLQYEALKRGFGPKPKPTDTVEVHYQGTLIDGTVFDSSIQRGQPATFQVGGVIPGWVEALQLMSVGDKWKLTVPASLAYGARGTPNIPPNSVLIFEVELLGIK